MLLFNTGFGTLQFSSWPACWLLISGNTICHYIEVWFVLWFILWTGLCFLSDILYLSRAALLKCNHPCTLLCQFYGYLVDWLVIIIIKGIYIAQVRKGHKYVTNGWLHYAGRLVEMLLVMGLGCLSGPVLLCVWCSHVFFFPKSYISMHL